ncbi:MAG: lytic transglycosylase domain-containing protein [Eubacteriales bacterium]|nr:lytic transglycosylase domain-containing protein [Eubacteriales bacterium]
MAKKLISVWLSLTVLIFSSISIYAEENVQGDFLTRSIIINGEAINNNYLQYPFFVYNDATYFPLTPEMEEVLGVKAKMDFESRTLKLLKTEPTLVNITDQWKKNERKDIQTKVLDEAQVLIYELESTKSIEAESADSANTAIDFNLAVHLGKEIKAPQLSVREIDLNDMPILAKDNVVYLPIKVLTGKEGMNWDVYYDSYTGVYVSTVEGIPAESYWMEEKSKYHEGLVSYIQNYNRSYTVNKAQELIFMFNNAAETYKIDEKILIAVAHRESTFNPQARGPSGSLGLMQVMPSTGARYGLSKQQLLDAETSINFGAMYLSEKIAAYDGNLTKGFSAYNQGSVPVNRGTYSTRYANKIIGAMNGINTHLTTNGYGLGENKPGS